MRMLLTCAYMLLAQAQSSTKTSKRNTVIRDIIWALRLNHSVDKIQTIMLCQAKYTAAKSKIRDILGKPILDSICNQMTSSWATYLLTRISQSAGRIRLTIGHSSYFQAAES